jgi:hypothetical protein
MNGGPWKIESPTAFFPQEKHRRLNVGPAAGVAREHNNLAQKQGSPNASGLPSPAACDWLARASDGKRDVAI